jgi:cytochrome c oxidase assembly protein subunit 15
MFTRTRVRRLAWGTAGFTFLLILLGRYTALTGAGLACAAQWPLCSGGTLPQTLPDFVEWFHRLMAMIAGFVVLGTAYGVWRTYDATRVRAASAAAVALLPVQVLLGRETVVSFGKLSILGHLAAGVLVFGAMVATAVWTTEIDARAVGEATRADGAATSTTESPGGPPARPDD